jgi:hypothetical protein
MTDIGAFFWLPCLALCVFLMIRPFYVEHYRGKPRPLWPGMVSCALFGSFGYMCVPWVWERFQLQLFVMSFSFGIMDHFFPDLAKAHGTAILLGVLAVDRLVALPVMYWAWSRRQAQFQMSKDELELMKARENILKPPRERSW